jgi:short-subunit dehydrogenase
MSAYCASKHAFGAFSDSLRMEMAMFDIKVREGLALVAAGL